MSAFTFRKCNIGPGEIIAYCNDPTTTCVVLDDKNVEFQGKKYSLSALETALTGSKWGVAGPRYFKYKGEWLNDVRHRVTGE